MDLKNTVSKQLGHDDESGFEFVKELLENNTTAAVNFDRLQKHPTKGYIIFEYLLCDEKQPNVTPYTSHPKKYWNKNKSKFLSLWRARNSLNATLYLVNYAKKGTAHEDEILLIEVMGMDENGITSEKTKKYTRNSFKDWFVELNNDCLQGVDSIVADIYEQEGKLSSYKLDYGKHMGKTIGEVDIDYLDFLVSNKHKHYEIIKRYLELLK